MEISRREADILPQLELENLELLRFIEKFGDLVRKVVMDNWEKTNDELITIIKEKTS